MARTAGILLAMVLAHSAFGQVLNLPPRAADALSGTEVIAALTPLSVTHRENIIYSEIAQGNVPDFLRNLIPITITALVSGTNHTATYHAAPDYMALGSNDDYFLVPMTPVIAQQLAELLDCTMPTRKMVNQIWTNAAVKLSPSTIPPSAAMTTVPVFAQHNATVRAQRNLTANSFPPGALVAGTKKDVVISLRIHTNFANANITRPVVIYGWHYTNGIPIQPLYNGHEETYADYSHGIRLVQNAMTLNGEPATVSQILGSPSLSVLLSDEGVINVPRYPVAQTAPVIVLQPHSRTVVPGDDVTFKAVARGPVPVGYQWRRGGSNIVGATASRLTLTEVQAAEAANYSVLVTNSVGSSTSQPAVLKIDSTVHPGFFFDNFETSSVTNWTLRQGSANDIPDYTVQWAYSYRTNRYTFNGSSYLIPPAPRAKTSHGVRFTVNNNDTTGAICGVNIYSQASFTGNFRLTCDMWMNYPGDSGGSGATGSTETALFGLNHLGTQPNWAATNNAPSTDGIWFGVNGEGGVSLDYRAFAGNSPGLQTELLGPGASGLSQSNSTAAIYQTLFPSSRFETPGAPGKNWVAVELSQSNNVMTWKLDGTVVAQRTNTSSFTSGRVMLGYMDTFASIANPAADAFVLFDNVRVENLSAPPLQPPSVIGHPQNVVAPAGNTIVLTVEAGGAAPLLHQWEFNGVVIAGATGSSLTLSNVQPENAGSYRARVSNDAGIVRSAPAALDILLPGLRFGSVTVLGNGASQVTLSGAGAASYSIEASTNLTNWLPLAVQAASNGMVSFTDLEAPAFPRRFYRARQESGDTFNIQHSTLNVEGRWKSAHFDVER